MNVKQMYAEALNLPTLEERGAALRKMHSMKRVRILDAWVRFRVWLALKIAPAHYFDE